MRDVYLLLDRPPPPQCIVRYSLPLLSTAATVAPCPLDDESGNHHSPSTIKRAWYSFPSQPISQTKHLFDQTKSSAAVHLIPSPTRRKERRRRRGVSRQQPTATHHTQQHTVLIDQSVQLASFADTFNSGQQALRLGRDGNLILRITHGKVTQDDFVYFCRDKKYEVQKIFYHDYVRFRSCFFYYLL